MMHVRSSGGAALVAAVLVLLLLTFNSAFLFADAAPASKCPAIRSTTIYVSSCGSATVGSTCTISCASGFYGSTVNYTCTRDPTTGAVAWSPSALPVCTCMASVCVWAGAYYCPAVRCSHASACVHMRTFLLR